MNEEFHLVLRPVPDPVLKRTPTMRLRAALKTLLRGYSLRCVSCREGKRPSVRPTGAESESKCG